jgi:hypothetical protein
MSEKYLRFALLRDCMESLSKQFGISDERVEELGKELARIDTDAQIGRIDEKEAAIQEDAITRNEDERLWLIALGIKARLVLWDVLR